MPSILSKVEDFEFFPPCKDDLHCRLELQSGLGFLDIPVMKGRVLPADILDDPVVISSYLAGMTLDLK